MVLRYRSSLFLLLSFLGWCRSWLGDRCFGEIIDKADACHLGVVATAHASLLDADVTTVAARKLWRNLVNQLVSGANGCEAFDDLAAVVQIALLGLGDEFFYVRHDFFCFWKRRFDRLVADE